MAEPIGDNGYFQEKLAEFQAKLAEFNQVLARVRSAAVTDPELQAEKDELISRAEFIQSSIQKAQDAINWANQQLKSFGDTWLDGNQLGLAPLAIVGAVAAIAGAVAYMSSWISDAYAWSKKAEIVETMTQSGATPGEISQALDAAQNGMNWGALGLIAAAAIGYWMYTQR